MDPLAQVEGNIENSFILKTPCVNDREIRRILTNQTTPDGKGQGASNFPHQAL